MLSCSTRNPCPAAWLASLTWARLVRAGWAAGPLATVTGVDALNRWLDGLGTLQVVGLVLGVVFGGSLLAALVGALLVRAGMRRPAVVERASGLSLKALTLVKRPLTIVVLDEVAAVIQTGRYTQNISAALLENHDEITALVAEKLREDRATGVLRRVPGYDAVVAEATETTLRVVVAMLADPRTDELVADLLRNNLEQIKRAVRDRDHERVGPPAPPDPVPPGAPAAQARAT